jgi:hypothetical protein
VHHSLDPKDDIAQIVSGQAADQPTIESDPNEERAGNEDPDDSYCAFLPALQLPPL